MKGFIKMGLLDLGDGGAITMASVVAVFSLNVAAYTPSEAEKVQAALDAGFITVIQTATGAIVWSKRPSSEILTDWQEWIEGNYFIER